MAWIRRWRKKGAEPSPTIAPSARRSSRQGQAFEIEDQSFRVSRHRFFDALRQLRQWRDDGVPLPPKDDADAVRRLLIERLRREGWEVLFDNDGDINRIALANHGMLYEQANALLMALGPVVRSGSFLHASTLTHNARLWTWAFDGQGCLNRTRRIERETVDPLEFEG